MYNTTRITVKNNLVSNSAGSGIAFVDSSDSIAMDNVVTGAGYCIAQLRTVNNVISRNTCDGGLGLKLVNSTGLQSDMSIRSDKNPNQKKSKNGASSMAPLLSLIYAISLIL
jgi:parallel beta-helix repeat protein